MLFRDVEGFDAAESVFNVETNLVKTSSAKAGSKAFKNQVIRNSIFVHQVAWPKGT